MMKRKQIFCILLTVLALGCNAQEPRPMYSVEYVDSINLAHSQEIEVYQELLNNQNLIGNVDLSVLDTASGAVTSLQIISSDKWYSIVENNFRYNFWIVENELEIWLGDGINSDLIVRYDLDSKTLTYFQYK